MATTDSLLPVVGRNIFGNGMGGGGSVFASNGSSGGASSITNSLLLDSSASQYLSRTPSVAGNQKKWTWSGWVKSTRN